MLGGGCPSLIGTTVSLVPIMRTAYDKSDYWTQYLEEKGRVVAGKNPTFEVSDYWTKYLEEKVHASGTSEFLIHSFS